MRDPRAAALRRPSSLHLHGAVHIPIPSWAWQKYTVFAAVRKERDVLAFRERGSPRLIINVGSVGAKFALPFGAALNSSKAAFESISDSLRMELRPWGIHVALVSPGSIRTSAEAKLLADSEALLNSFSAEGKALYASSYRAFIRAFIQLESHGVGPEVVAETVHRALTARSPKRRYPVGPKSRLLPFLFTTLPASVADTLRLRLFHVYRPFGRA